MLQSLFHVILLLLMKPKRCVAWVWLVINMQPSCPINGRRAWLSPCTWWRLPTKPKC